MIFLTEQLLKDNKKLLNLIDDEIALNQASLKSQKALKILLLDYMQKLATSTIVEPSNSSQILKVLLSFKSSLELSKTNIINLENLISLFNDIKAQDPSAILSNIDVFNSTIIDINEELFKNNSEILQTLKLTLDNSIKISTTDTKNTNNNNNNKTQSSENSTTESTLSETTTISENITTENSTNSEEIKIENTVNSNENLTDDVQNVANTSEENNSIESTHQDETSNESKTSETSSIEEAQIQEIIQDANKEIAEEIENESEISNVETSQVEENQNDSISSTTQLSESQKATAEIKNNYENSVSNNQESEKEQEKIESIKKQIQESIEEPITIKENTLIISEKTKKVFLPYDCDSLEIVFKNNPDEYSSVEDIIRKDFIVPLASYKIPSVSRFRESYKLMRIKENRSFKESLDLAFELFFNYNLHPAIISACRNLDELDIYLDYLSDNETHKFSCFDIVFEVSPTTTSKHSIIPKKTNF